MLVSYNEIEQTTAKALEALGWARGEREDGAAAIAWLELNGMNGVSLLVNRLPELSSPYKTKLIQTGDNEFDAQGQSCLLVGPRFIDWCTVHGRNRGAILKNCSDQSAILPYLIQIVPGLRTPDSSEDDIQNREYIFAIWIDSSQETTQCWRFKSDQSPVFSLHQMNNISGDTSSTLRIDVSGLKSYIPLRSTLYPGIPNSSRNSILSTGLEVADNEWEILKEAAKGILVPESELSRLRGAGDSSEAN